MPKGILIALVILVILTVIWCMISGSLIRYGQREINAVNEKISKMKAVKRFTATVVSTEILSGWSVLMCKPDDGSEGFYLKTTNRSITPNTRLGFVQFDDFPEKDEVLRSSQVRPDEEFGKRIPDYDYDRVISKLQGDISSGRYFIHLGSWLMKVGMIIAVLIFVILMIALIVWKKHH
jgi:hypothetical protein